MRLLASLGVGVLGVTLWSLLLWRGGLPVEVAVRPALRPGEPQAPHWLRATVTQTFPALEGLALGDAVRFDRYGLVAPVAGTVHCTPLAPGALEALIITPIGGRRTHEGRLRLDLVAPDAPGCEPERPRALLPLHP
jgi:hypothetical protein